MKKDNLRIVDWLLSSGRSAAPDTYPGFGAFRQAFFKETASWNTPVDRAIVGGCMADCVAYAFAAGYNAALQCLVPALPATAITCFCITEKDGGHPRAIRTKMVASGMDANRGKAYTINGRKKYITCAAQADLFLVAVSEGVGEGGRNRIRMIKMDAKTPGIRIVPMEGLHLVPEISHGEIILTDVAALEADLLPGDGYTAYIKPFRTIEDVHVSAAMLGYLFRNACRYDWGRDIRQTILARIVLVRNLAFFRPDAPAVHIVMGDAIKQVKDLIKRVEPLWETAGREAKEAWDRDKALINIADKARALRLDAAWKAYEEP